MDAHISSLFQQAAFHGDIEGLSAMVDAHPGLLVERNGFYLKIALHAAVRRKQLEAVKWLLSNGADIEGYDEFTRESPLFSAVKSNHKEMMDFLIARGANVNATNPYEDSLLHTAVRRGNLSVIETLLDCPRLTSINAQGGMGQTCLHQVVIYDTHGNKAKILDLLFKAGADPRIRDEIRSTALEVARRRNQTSCIGPLKNYLAEPDRVSLLHRARLINDTHHAMDKVASDADTDGDSAEVKKQKCIKAAPDSLKGRVERGEELPIVEIGTIVREPKKKRKRTSIWVGPTKKRKRQGETINEDPEQVKKDDEVVAAVVEHVVLEGKLVKEIFVDLMDYMMEKWDDQRTRA